MIGDFREPWCEQAARVLAETMRESRLCLLYGARDARRHALLEDGLVPLLRQGDTPERRERRVAASPIDFADRRSESWPVPAALADRRDLVIQFSAWHLSPLPVLRMLIDGALSDAWSEEELARNPLSDEVSASDRHLGPGGALVTRIGALHQRFGVRFLFVFDDFEEFLDAPPDRDDLAQFRREFVEAVDHEALAVSFLIAVREDAAPLLKGLRRRIAGFDDNSFQLLALDDDTGAIVPLPHGDEALLQRGALRHSPVTVDDVYWMIEAFLEGTAGPIAGPSHARGAASSAMPGKG